MEGGGSLSLAPSPSPPFRRSGAKSRPRESPFLQPQFHSQTPLKSSSQQNENTQIKWKLVEGWVRRQTPVTWVSSACLLVCCYNSYLLSDNFLNDHFTNTTTVCNILANLLISFNICVLSRDIHSQLISWQSTLSLGLCVFTVRCPVPGSVLVLGSADTTSSHLAFRLPTILVLKLTNFSNMGVIRETWPAHLISY